MEKRIENIVHLLCTHEISKSEAIKELLNLHSVRLSLPDNLEFEDLKKIGDLYIQLDDMISTTDINEDLIEMMQKPLYAILKANGCDWEERDI